MVYTYIFQRFESWDDSYQAHLPWDSLWSSIVWWCRCSEDQHTPRQSDTHCHVTSPSTAASLCADHVTVPRDVCWPPSLPQWRLYKMPAWCRDDSYASLPRQTQHYKRHLTGHNSSSRKWRHILRLSTNTWYWPNAGLMLGQRRRRWPNIDPALGQHIKSQITCTCQ